MPISKLQCFLDNNESHFKTQKAILSRIFANMRWIIENVIVILKNKYQALDGNLENKSLPDILEDLRKVSVDSFK